MADNILDMLMDATVSCFDWFVSVVGEADLFGLVLGSFIVYTSWRLLLAPLMGGSYSDTARKRDDEDGDD